MGQPAIKWGSVERYFMIRGYEIRHSGGDKIIIAPKDGNPLRNRQSVLIGHNYSDRKGDLLAPGHLAKIRRAFGVTREDILNDR